MSDLVIFIVGTGVFAITTTATLVYGYLTFQGKARREGIAMGDDIVESAPAEIIDQRLIDDTDGNSTMSIEVARISPSPAANAASASMAGR